jgi:DNA invertase Pin-like site-specific DNA recombinase
MADLDGGRWTLIAEFTEIESGKRNDRPELERALAACKKQKAGASVLIEPRLARWRWRTVPVDALRLD